MAGRRRAAVNADALVGWPDNPSQHANPGRSSGAYSIHSENAIVGTDDTIEVHYRQHCGQWRFSIGGSIMVRYRRHEIGSVPTA